MKSENEIKTHFLFEKINYRILLIGIAVIAIGFILMSGGGSDDPNIFKENELFSWRRIRLAPTVVLIGFGITIYAILKNPNKALKDTANADTFPEEKPIKNFTNKKK